MKKFTAKQIIIAAKVFYSDKVVKGENGQGLDTAYAAFVGSIYPEDHTFGTVEMMNLYYEADSRDLDADPLAKYAAAGLMREIKEQAENANPTEEKVSGIAIARMVHGVIDTLNEIFETFVNNE